MPGAPPLPLPAPVPLPARLSVLVEVGSVSARQRVVAIRPATLAAWIRRTLWHMQTSGHSPRALCNPRIENRRNPIACSICPKTGFGRHFRLRYIACPSVVLTLWLIRCCGVAVGPGGSAGSVGAGAAYVPQAPNGLSAAVAH